jgi:hypothetical protein
VDDSFVPYGPGDILFISETAIGAPIENPNGAVCAVETADGRRLIRRVTAQTNGLYTLSSWVGGLPEPDVALIRVSRMVLHQPKAFQLFA